MKTEVSKEGYFSIDHLEVSAIKWNDFDNEFNASNAFSDDGYKVAKYMRAVAESMLVSHFGDAIIDEVFLRYRKIIADRISKENCQFINVTISITKIGWLRFYVWVIENIIMVISSHEWLVCLCLSNNVAFQALVLLQGVAMYYHLVFSYVIKLRASKFGLDCSQWP